MNDWERKRQEIQSAARDANKLAKEARHLKCELNECPHARKCSYCGTGSLCLQNKNKRGLDKVEECPSCGRNGIVVCDNLLYAIKEGTMAWPGNGCTMASIPDANCPDLATCRCCRAHYCGWSLRSGYCLECKPD